MKDALTITLAAATVFLLGSCDDYPRDPERTLDRVLQGTLRAGASENPPFVEVRDGIVSGLEPLLVGRFAESLGARIEWITGTENDLLARLERHELDIVVCGITADSPWKKRVAFTNSYPYRPEGAEDEKRVLAVAPGENRFLLELEQFLAFSPEKGEKL